MRFNFYTPVYFESWDWTNSVEKGIGGSETHQTEMVWRLARRGHEVYCYSPTPWKGERMWRGVHWAHLDEANFTAPGIWVIYRAPHILPAWKKNDAQQIWLVMQDEGYSWPAGSHEKVDRVLAFCSEHLKVTLESHPKLAGKVFLTSNGVKVDLIREAEKRPPARNPKKLIYASSPDRGLKALVSIFQKAREYVPDLELHAFYGFDNIDKLIKHGKQFSRFKTQKAELLALLKAPGVVWHGRVSQRELYREWLSAGIWCYPTNFTETSCITCMEAQSLGAIPITNPLWALADNVNHGTLIPGDAWHDPLVQSSYAAEIVRLASNPIIGQIADHDVTLQDSIRVPMMQQARNRFNWERMVDQWEAWIGGYQEFTRISQYAFQHKHVNGRVLNVGCDIDLSNLKGRGAVNVDIQETSPILGEHTRADLIADARALPPVLHGRFHRVILGDILEHMTDGDIVKSLRSARRCLTDDGMVVVTCPDDPRPDPHAQHQHGMVKTHYAPNIPAYHTRAISRAKMTALLRRAGLKATHYQVIDYTFFLGHGILAVPIGRRRACRKAA